MSDLATRTIFFISEITKISQFDICITTIYLRTFNLWLFFHFFFVFLLFFTSSHTALVEAGWGRRDAWNIFFFFITLTSFFSPLFFFFFYFIQFEPATLCRSLTTSKTSSSIIFLLHTANLITQFNSLLYLFSFRELLLLHRLDQSRHRDSIYDFSFWFIRRAEKSCTHKKHSPELRISRRANIFPLFVLSLRRFNHFSYSVVYRLLLSYDVLELVTRNA